MSLWSDIGNAVSSAASALGNAVEETVDAVADIVTDAVDAVTDAIQDGVDQAVDWACDNGGDIGCGAANVVGGSINGMFEGASDLVSDVCDIARDVSGILGSLLSLDFAGVVAHLVELSIHLVIFGADFIRVSLGGHIVGGIINSFHRTELRRFVAELLDRTFSHDPDRLRQAREHVGVGRGVFGLPIEAEHRIFMFDSANTDLRQWHLDGEIDLYALAQLLTVDSWDGVNPYPGARTVIKAVSDDGQHETLLPIMRYTLAKYIDEGKGRIRLYAMSDAVAAEKMRVASDRFKKLGIRLSWHGLGAFSRIGSTYAYHEVNDESEYRIDAESGEQYLLNEALRSGAEDQDDSPIALGAFRFALKDYKKNGKLSELRGTTLGRDITDGPSVAPCQSARTDHCCNTIERAGGTGVIHRDVWPYHVARYILVHELGHYLGLCHFGHDGASNHIMYSVVDDVSWFDWSMLPSLYLDSEPEFTIDDAKNSWRFIVSVMSHCLTP
jgi:hypothetical protein